MKHTVQLYGTSRADLGLLSYKNQRKGPVGPLLRKALLLGDVSEGDTVVVMRGNTVVFPERPVTDYTNYTYVENDNGIRRVVYQPWEKDE